MIYFIRLKDVPRFLVSFTISIALLLVMIPVWMANPHIINSTAAVMVQFGLIIGVGFIASGPLCGWIKRMAQSATSASTKPAIPPAVVSRPASTLPQSNAIQSSAAKLPESPAVPAKLPLEESIATLIGDTFSSSRFIEMFGSQSFSEEWSVQEGLAAWYFFGSMVLDIAVYTSMDSAATSFARIGNKFMSKQWHMPDAVLDKFNALRHGTASPAFHAFIDSNTEAEYYIFFSRCVSRILGQELPFTGPSIDLVLQGIEPRVMDPGLTRTYATLFSETLFEARRRIRESLA